MCRELLYPPSFVISQHDIVRIRLFHHLALFMIVHLQRDVLETSKSQKCDDLQTSGATRELFFTTFKLVIHCKAKVTLMVRRDFDFVSNTKQLRRMSSRGEREI